MAYRNFLLAYSGNAEFDSALGHAIKLVHHHDGWLTAMVQSGSPLFDRYSISLPDKLREQLRDAETQNVKNLADHFHATVKAAGIDERAEFVLPDDIGNASPSEVARHYDMVITGFQSHRASEEHRSASPDLIALTSGRPVLVIPRGYDAEGLADHALVAWDGKRSAARALGDAMSILETKAKVTVLTVSRDHPDPKTMDYLIRNLERHGIVSEHIHKTGKGKKIAIEIEDTADAIGAKLIVMGAYEHSKFSQDIFGGVTHEVLRSARVPVFMSH